jgi:2-dehydro-3-deoxyphosphooctonate aldolase (KDO 8-P synthase)
VHVRQVSVGGVVFGGGALAVIAGPCVIEDRRGTLENARRIRLICDNAGVPVVFKASFDKANRTSHGAYRGPGLEEGLDILREVGEKTGLPIITDIHEAWQAEPVAAVADCIQIPAFLCRQTDLIAAAAATGLPVNIKKGQFVAPQSMGKAVEKARASGRGGVMLTERGSSFGYNTLVVDFRALAIMRQTGVPVIFDATHSVQAPGALGGSSGGDRRYVLPLARAAAAVGVDGIFVEVHKNPDRALSDGPNSINHRMLAELLEQVMAIHGCAR